MLEAPVRGGSLAAFELTSAPADAPLVLAVHGITANSRSWVAVARALEGWARLVAVDLRGRGASRELPGPFGLAVHGEDLLAVLGQLGARRAVLAGHSLGAYIVARFAVEHPDRVEQVVMVDGGLRIPGSQDAEPPAFLDAFLGPTLERLAMQFESPESYRAWWHAHPALADADLAEEDLAAFTDHDLVGEPGAMRSAVSVQAVRGDAADLFDQPAWADQLAVPAVLLCAPLGLRGEPSPMQPFELAQAWADTSARLRRAALVPGANHYTIMLGRSGARAVAQELAGAPGPARSSPPAG